MDRIGKTKVSANLHKSPGSKRIVDQLEPHYPLIVHDDKDGMWLHVTARPKGQRTESQDGFIDCRLVEVFKPEVLLRPSEWRVLYVALGAPILFALLWWFLS